MTRPTVLMEMYLGGAWRDITAYVHLPSGIIVTRGRDNEQGSPNPGTLSFTVKTDGGRFIVGNPAAPAPFNAFARWAPVRYSINGVRRFTGFVSSAPASWRSSKLSQVPIVCTDLLGMMAMSPTVESWAHELIEDLSPLYWWPLDDAEGSVTATPAAGGLPLTASYYIAPDTGRSLADALQFGQSADAVALAGGSGVGALEADSQVRIVHDGTAMWASLGTLSLTGLATPFTAFCIWTPAVVTGDTGRTIFSLGAGVRGVGFYRLGSTLMCAEATEDSGHFHESGGDEFPAVRVGSPIALAITFSATSITIRANGVSDTWTTTDAAGSPGAIILGGEDGLYCHATIIQGAISEATWSSLLARLMGQGSAPVSTWLKRACTAAGITTDPTATLDRTMERPALKGSNPAAVAETLASSAGAMCVASRDGVLTWIDWTWCPAVVDLVEPLTQDARWGADDSLYYTHVQVDGTTKAVSPTNTFPRKSREVPGLLPDGDQQSFVTWLANTSDIWAAPRASGLVVNLWPLSAARVTAYLGLDLRSRVRLTTLPEGMPTPMIATVEGYTETVTESVWIMQLQTAPDPSLVWEDDITTWESDYRINPF